MRRLHEGLESVQTLNLLAYVAIADALLVFVGIPFELSCLRAIASADQSSSYLVAVFVANTCILAYMYTAASVTTELMRRGVTLTGAVLARIRRRK